MSASVSVQPNKRLIVGRRIMLVSAATFALSRALYYIPNDTHTAEVAPAIQLISGPASIWVWVALWTTVTALCVRDVFRGEGTLGISSLFGAMMLWGSAYLFSYIGTVFNEGFGSREWFSFAGYAFAGGVIYGLLMIVGALKNKGE